MKKNANKGWQWADGLTKVCALSFLVQVVCLADDTGADDAFIKLRESQMARQQAEAVGWRPLASPGASAPRPSSSE